jgi:putative membrane protein
MSTTQPLLSRDLSKRGCLALFLVLWAISSIRVPYPKYFPIQHVPTVAAVIGLVWADRRFGISRTSYILILTFLALHLLGARYLYSYVPYDDWTQKLLGFRITQSLSLSRNHYDRLVHFGFGLLLLPPLDRFCRRIVGLDNRWTIVFAVSLIVSASACYEVFEWIVAVIMAPDWADSYNGQQGDPWDAQADMLLALIGALFSVAFLAIVRGRQNSY